MRFATPQGFNSEDQFFAYLRNTFDVLYEERAITLYPLYQPVVLA